MKTTLLAVAIALIAFPAGLAAEPPAETNPEDEARIAAEAWLDLLDAGDYEATWAEAAGTFQAATTADGWADQVGAVRRQAGDFVSREFVSAEVMTDPPGAPAGEYVQVRFDSGFAHVRRASEVVVLVDEGDRGWRVAGYFVLPPEA